MWTPAVLPPHPSSIPLLTPLAQRVLDLLGEEVDGTRQTRPQGSRYRATVTSHPPILKDNPMPKIAERNDVFENKNSERMDITPNWNEPRHFPNMNTDFNSTSVREVMPLTTPIWSKNHTEFSIQHQNQPVVYSRNPIVKNLNKKNGSFDKPCCTKNYQCEIECEYGQSKDFYDHLSPDMEFDDMHIYSIPNYEATSKVANAVKCNDPFNSKPLTNLSLKHSFSNQFEANPINLKGINTKSAHTGGPYKNESLDYLSINNVFEPTDQTFEFSKTANNNKYKDKLAMYRVTSGVQENRKRSSYFIPNVKSTLAKSLKKESENNTHNILMSKQKHCDMIEGFEKNHYCKTNKTGSEAKTESYNNADTSSNLSSENARKKKFNDSQHDEIKENSINTEFSEHVESLFIKTQDYVVVDETLEIGSKNTNNENISNLLSEEFDITPHQVNREKDYDIDDLFSLNTENLQKPLEQSNLNKSIESSKPHDTMKYNTKHNIEQCKVESLSCPNKGIKLNQLLTTDSNESLNNDNGKDALTIIFGEEDYKTVEYPIQNQIHTNTNLKQNTNNSCKITSNEGEMILQRKTHRSKNSSIQVEVQIQDRKLLTKLVNKKTPLKQTTLFDCRKFLTPNCKKENSNDPELKGTENPTQFDTFKKPLQVNKGNSCTKTIKQQSRPQQKWFKETKSIHQFQLKSIGDENKTSQNKITAEETKNGLVKKIQTNLIKSESTKRSSTTKKPEKKPRFAAPIMASHTTSQEAALKNYTITVLNNVTAKEILQRLTIENLKKVAITVTFKEGYTLLNKPTMPMKNSRCFPSGVMFLVYWNTNSKDYYWLNLLDLDPTDLTIQAVIHTLLSKPDRIICFEAQAVFMLFMDIFHSQNISGWYALDPLVGCWLLDPDNPPKDFSEFAVKLNMDQSLLAVNPKADTKTQACDLLPVLDVAMDLLQLRLTNASLWTLFCEMEMKLTPLLALMECSSINVDIQRLHETAATLDKRLKHLQREAQQLVGHPFQLNSHKQLREVLFDELKLDTKLNVSVKQTEQGYKSTSEAVLSQLKDLHPLPKIILEHRHLQKIKSTYIDGLIQHVKPDGTLGTTWEQVGAATGRITSKNPNLQAIPKVPVVLEDGEKIHLRAVFKAREGFVFLAADCQQIEFRVFAHFTQQESLLMAFREGGDIFQRLAKLWLGGEGAQEREKTKHIVYSVMYGVGPSKLAEYLHVNQMEASNIIANFTETFPSLRSLPRKVIAQCRQQGYIVTLSGRRRLFPNIRSTNSKLRSYSERQAINFLIQGSAADICKAAMLDCDRELRARGLQARLLLQIHDELVWEVPRTQLQNTAKTVRNAMEHHWNNRLALKVPVPVCISSGKTLGDLQPLEMVTTAADKEQWL